MVTSVDGFRILLCFVILTLSWADNVFLKCGPGPQRIACRHGEGPVESNISSAGAKRSCATNEDGSFGETMGDSEEVPYYCQIETVPGVDADTMNMDILGDVEQQINTILLSILFTEQCGLSQQTETGDRREARRRLTAVGIDTQLPDVVLDAVPCKGNLINEEDMCFVVDGSLSVYVKEGTETTQLADQIRETIKQAMDGGQLDNAHESIMKISYLSDDDFQTSSSSQNKGNDSENSDDTGLSWLWALLGTCGALVLMWLCLKRLRQKLKQREFEAKESDEEDAASQGNGVTRSLGENANQETMSSDENTNMGA